MASITFSKIFFALAMCFLQPDAKITKISVTMDGNTGAVWTLQADGAWHGSELIRTPATDTGTWAYDATKKIITHTPAASQPDAKPDTTDLSTFLKIGTEKPEPTTVEFQGKTISAVRKGDDIVLSPKDPPAAGAPAEHPVIIHYEK